MSNEVVPTNGAASDLAVTDEQRTLVKSLLAADATPAELELFFYDCRRRGVHPLDRLIHFTKRKGKYVPVTSIHFMRLRADDGGRCGQDEPEFHGKEMQPDYECKVTVYKHHTIEGKIAYTGTAKWKEFVPSEAFMWQKMPSHMLAKCAEAVALRLAFPRELAGLYVPEELDHVEGRPVIEVSTTPTLTLKGKLKAKAAPPESVAQVAPSNQDTTGGLAEHAGAAPGQQQAAVPDASPVFDMPPTTESVSDKRHGGPAEPQKTVELPDTPGLLTLKISIAKTVKEWSETENAALSVKEQGGFTAGEWATYRGVSDQTKKSLTGKR